MERTSEGAVVRRVEGNIGHITFNRVHRLNAFNLELANQFLETLESFRRSEDVRAVVLRGAGRVFSVGGDVRAMSSDVELGKDRAAYFRAPLAAFHKIVLAIREIPKPVLAVVQGAVAGVAFNVMLACDLRLAAAGTRFTQAFVKLGLSPDGGGTWFLPREVGYAACRPQHSFDTSTGQYQQVVPSSNSAAKSVKRGGRLFRRGSVADRNVNEICDWIARIAEPTNGV